MDGQRTPVGGANSAHVSQSEPSNSSNLPHEILARLFVKQYYTVLALNISSLHRFYSHDSSLIHGGLDRPEANEVATPVYGQEEISKKIASLNFHDCHAKIRQVDSLETVGRGVVIQVSGELSNNGQPMRRFQQTFVLVPQTASKYYVRNDIFRYQDEIYDDEAENEAVLIDSTGKTSTYQATTNSQQEILNPRVPPPSPQVLAPVPPGGDSTLPNSALPQIIDQHHPAGPPAPAVPSKSSNGALENEASRPVVVAEPKTKSDPRNKIPTDEFQQDSKANLPKTGGPSGGISSESQQAGKGGSENVLLPTPPPNLRQGRRDFSPTTRNITQEPDIAATNSSSGKSGGDGQEKRSWAQAAAPASQDGQKFSQTPHPSSPMPPNLRYETTPQQSIQPPLAAHLNKPPPNHSHPPSRRDPHPKRSPKDREGTPSKKNEVAGMDGSGLEVSDMKGGKQYPDNQQVFVGNLLRNHGEDELRKYFSRFGKILDVRISRQNQKNSGSATPNYGFVTFESPDIVQTVLSQKPIYFNNHRFNVEAKRPSGSGRAGNGPLSKGNEDNRSNPNRSASNMKNDRRDGRQSHHFHQGSLTGSGGGASNLAPGAPPGSGHSPGNRGGPTGGSYGSGSSARR